MVDFKLAPSAEINVTNQTKLNSLAQSQPQSKEQSTPLSLTQVQPNAQAPFSTQTLHLSKTQSQPQAQALPGQEQELQKQNQAQSPASSPKQEQPLMTVQGQPLSQAKDKTPDIALKQELTRTFTQPFTQTITQPQSLNQPQSLTQVQSLTPSLGQPLAQDLPQKDGSQDGLLETKQTHHKESFATPNLAQKIAPKEPQKDLKTDDLSQQKASYYQPEPPVSQIEPPIAPPELPANASLETKDVPNRQSDMQMNMLLRPLHPDYRLCCAGVTCRGLRHLQQQKDNQDAMYISPLAAGALIVLADGVGSCTHAAYGSQSLGPAVKQICDPMTQSQAMPLFEELEPSLDSLEDLDIPQFLKKVHAAWCKNLQAQGFNASDCKTTCQILWAYKQQLLVASLGDGIIGVLCTPPLTPCQILNFEPLKSNAPLAQGTPSQLSAQTQSPAQTQSLAQAQSSTLPQTRDSLTQLDHNHMQIFSQTKQSFVNETFALGENDMLKAWDYKVYPLEQVQGVIACTDGISSELEKARWAEFMTKLLQDLSVFSPREAAKQLKAMLLKWPEEFCLDDQTLLAIYPYLPQRHRKRPSKEQMDEVEATCIENNLILSPIDALAANFHRFDRA